MNNQQRLEQLETEHNELREAHRALAAEHLSIKAFISATLPLLAPTRNDAIRVATVSIDTLNAWLCAGDCDDEFQRTAREALESLSAALVAVSEQASHRPAGRGNP